MAGRKKTDTVSVPDEKQLKALTYSEKIELLEATVKEAAEWLYAQTRAREGKGTMSALTIVDRCQHIIHSIADRENGQDQNVTIKFELPGK